MGTSARQSTGLRNWPRAIRLQPRSRRWRSTHSRRRRTKIRRFPSNPNNKQISDRIRQGVYCGALLFYSPCECALVETVNLHDAGSVALRAKPIPETFFLMSFCVLLPMASPRALSSGPKLSAPISSSASGLLLVTVTGENGQAGILGKSRVSLRKITEEEGRAARRFNATGMNTLGAQSRAGKTYYFFGRVRHNGRIAQLDGLSERSVEVLPLKIRRFRIAQSCNALPDANSYCALIDKQFP